MTTVIQHPTFPAALVTESRATYWRSQWYIHLSQEIKRSPQNAEEITKCEEHIAMATLAIESLKANA